MRTTLVAALLTAAITGHALADNHQTVAELCGTIRANYVFPDIAESTAAHIEQRLEAGHYDGLDPNALASALTRDLQAFTNDRHFSARALPEGWTPPSQPEPGAEQPEPDQPIDPRAHAPHGFHEISRLPGNIAYLDLRGFHPEPHARHSVIPAVRLMQGASSVIVDLRKNGGGDPATVQLLCSYFFDPAEPLLLNSLYFRPADETTEFWTNAEHPELTMPDTPVYVLTSSYTFSGAEEFAYNLQTRDRATIIGETTGGGAHPVNAFVIDNTLSVYIPVGRAINPITNTNWEGTGVTPDIQVPADDALNTALARALRAAMDAGDPNAAWGLYQHTAESRSFEIPLAQLAQYAGNYTDREIELTTGQLRYRRVGAPSWRPLVAVDDDTFMIEGIHDFYMRFERNDANTISGIVGHYENGHRDRSARQD